MEKNTLRVRLVSFKDSAKQSLDMLCYIKKLTQLPSNNGKTFLYYKKVESIQVCL